MLIGFVAFECTEWLDMVDCIRPPIVAAPGGSPLEEPGRMAWFYQAIRYPIDWLGA